jgi:hypothetical protein
VTDEKADISADKWYCHLNTWDPAHNTCEAVEEPSSPDAQAAAAAAAQQQAAWAMAAQQQQHPTQPHGLANPFAAQIGAAKKAAPAAGGASSGRKRKKKRGSDDDSAEDTSATNSADEAFYAHIDGAASTTRRSAREKKPNIDEQYTHPDFDVEVSGDFHVETTTTTGSACVTFAGVCVFACVGALRIALPQSSMSMCSCC